MDDSMSLLCRSYDAPMSIGEDLWIVARIKKNKKGDGNLFDCRPLGSFHNGIILIVNCLKSDAKIRLIFKLAKKNLLKHKKNVSLHHQNRYSMKKVLGLDLGTTSIGWAMVNENESNDETSSIIRLGVRVNPLTVDEQTNFGKGNPITTNADRTQKRSMRRNLQRYKLRRDNLIALLKEQGWITDNTILSESTNNSTFETYRLRAKAASEEITLEQFARVLLMLNKKRGYKSNRKMKNNEGGHFVSSLDVAKEIYDSNLTPGQYAYRLITEGKRNIPDFYRSDLETELDQVWAFQYNQHKTVLTTDFRAAIANQSKTGTSNMFRKKFNIFTADIKGNRIEKAEKIYKLRNDALERALTEEELATVISEINGQINGSSGYLGAISDRSKILYINKQTVGQCMGLKTKSTI